MSTLAPPTPTYPVRKFDDAAIQAAVDEALRATPAGHNSAIVAHADLGGARLAVMYKLGDDWSFAGYLDKRWTGNLTAGAEVVFSPH